MSLAPAVRYVVHSLLILGGARFREALTSTYVDARRFASGRLTTSIFLLRVLKKGGLFVDAEGLPIIIDNVEKGYARSEVTKLGGTSSLFILREGQCRSWRFVWASVVETPMPRNQSETLKKR